MTYDQLTAFLRVASEGSFTKASASLHKSQPAVSKLVRTLEEGLGLELFDRSAYRATLTDAGRLFFERAATLIEATEALHSFARELAGDVEPIVRIAVEAVTPLETLVPILRETLSRFPGVRIELRTERLSGGVQAVAAGDADLAIATLVGVDTRAMETRHVASVRVLPVAHADHPLAVAASPIPDALLREHAQIVLRDSGHGETASLNLLPGGVRWTVTDVAAKQLLIISGLGWGGLPEHVVAQNLERGEVVELSVPAFETTAMELFAVRRRDLSRGPVMQALWSGVTENDWGLVSVD